MCLELRLNGILLFTGAVVVSCFIQSGALESPDVLLSYPITSLSSPMTCQCTDIYPLLSNIHVHLFIYLSIYLIILHNAMQVSHGKSLCRSLSLTLKVYISVLVVTCGISAALDLQLALVFFYHIFHII